MRRFVFAASALTILGACQPATTQLTEEQKAAITDTVNVLMAEYWDAERAADYDRARGYIHDSPEMIYARPKGRLFHPFETFDSRSRQVWVAMDRQAISIAESRTTALAPHLVSVIRRGTYTVTDTSGVTLPEAAFAFTALWARQDSEWRML